MASNRLISSEMWTDDEWFCELGFFQQLMWIGLFSKCADSQGRLRDSAGRIALDLWPDKDVPLDEVNEALAYFHTSRKILRYEADGRKYIQILKWWEYQAPKFARESSFPPPDGWIDHVRTTISREVVQKNWFGQAEHIRLEDAFIARLDNPLAMPEVEQPAIQDAIQVAIQQPIQQADKLSSTDSCIGLSVSDYVSASASVSTALPREHAPEGASPPIRETKHPPPRQPIRWYSPIVGNPDVTHNTS